MGFKEFLKPTKGKVILTASFFIIYMLIVLVLVLGSVSTLGYPSFVKCCDGTDTSDYCVEVSESIDQIFNITCDSYLKHIEQQKEAETKKNIFLALSSIVALVIFYITSCVLIFTYKKVVKK